MGRLSFHLNSAHIHNLFSSHTTLACPFQNSQSSLINRHPSYTYRQFKFQSTAVTGNTVTSLTNLRVHMWPSITNVLTNTVMTKFLINRYYDREFVLSEFIRGSKQAVEFVSFNLSKGDLKSLQGLVEPLVLAEIKTNLALFTLNARMALPIRRHDIYFSFPYSIHAVGPDKGSGGEETQSLEITMGYHSISGLAEMEEATNEHVSLSSIPNFEKKLSILNYRFKKSAHNNDGWIINGLNHSKPFVPIFPSSDEM